MTALVPYRTKSPSTRDSLKLLQLPSGHVVTPWFSVNPPDGHAVTGQERVFHVYSNDVRSSFAGLLGLHELDTLLHTRWNVETLENEFVVMSKKPQPRQHPERISEPAAIDV